MNGWKDAWTLRDYVASLLRDGKRSQHADFQALFTAFGKERVTAIAKEILDKPEKGDGGQEELTSQSRRRID